MGGIARLGLRESLAASDRTFVTEEVDAASVLDRAAAVVPDGVVLDMDAAGTADLAADLTARYPAVTVVACSMLEPRMRIYPARARGEPYDAPLTAPALAAALTSTA
jgi:DNA-binding NarL/FixJ family response regulator